MRLTYPSYLAPLLGHYALVVLGLYLSRFIAAAPDWAAADKLAGLGHNYPYLQGLLQWDAHHYIRIAKDGYSLRNSVQLPVYPFLIFVGHKAGLPYELAALALTQIATVAVFVLFDYALRGAMVPAQRQKTLWVLATFPTSFYLTAAYTESLFMAFTLACVLATFRQNWFLAAFFAGLATLTRNLGFVLEAWLVWALWPLHTKYGKWQRAWGPLLLPVAGLGSFMFYEYLAFGDALAFVHEQAQWGRSYSWPWQGPIYSFQLLNQTHFLPTKATFYNWINLGVWAMAWAGFACFVPWARRKPAWLPLALVCFLWMLVPLLSTGHNDPLLSVGRLYFICIPVFIGIALLPRALFVGIICAAGLSLVVATALFAKGWWIC